MRDQRARRELNLLGQLAIRCAVVLVAGEERLTLPEALGDPVQPLAE